MLMYHVGNNLASMTLVSENDAIGECNLAYHLYYSQSKRRKGWNWIKFLGCKMKSASLEHGSAECFHCPDNQPLIKHQGFVWAIYKYYSMHRAMFKTPVRVAYQLTTPSFSADLAFHILIFISSEPQRMYLLSIDHRTHVSLCIRFVW